MIEVHRSSLSRASAACLVGAIALVTLALNLWELRAHLPLVLHSDYVQVEQAVDLVTKGSLEDRAVYPLPLVYAYAACDLAAYAVGHTLGWEGYADWPTYLLHLARPEVHHAIGRALGALCAALLAVGAYRLARVRFDRRVAVLAAAVAAFSPLQTIYAHQVRPHVPVIMVVVLVAPAVLRAALEPTWKTGLLSGVATGIASAVFQVGLPFACSAVALVVLLGRPVRAWAQALPGMLLGFAVTWSGLFSLATKTGFLTPGSRQSGLIMRGEDGSLGYGLQNFFSHFGRFAKIGLYWLAAEPVCAVAFLGFLVLCLRGRRSWRDVVLHAVPACAMLAGMCLVHLARPRYSMYATPFLAPLAASAVLAIPSTVLRRVTVGLLVLVPLASSIRQDLLLGHSDTRVALHEALPTLAQSGLRVVVQADVLPALVDLPPGVAAFPPHADYRAWLRQQETPRQTLLHLAPDVFVCRRDASSPMTIGAADLQLMGFAPATRFGAERIFVPDDPEWVLPELWLADRPGPEIDIMARKEIVTRVRGLLPR